MPRPPAIPEPTAADVSDELTDKQRAFVAAFVANGGQRKAAAVEAGYAEASAHVEAHRLLKNPLILQEVNRLLQIEVALTGPEALRTQRELASTAKSAMVRHLAAKDLLDRAGFKPVDRAQVAVAGDLRVTIDLG